MKTSTKNLRSRVALLLAFLSCAPVSYGRSDKYDDIGVARDPNAVAWGGTRWSKSETDGFQGRPRTATDNDRSTFVTVAYGRYVSYYDVKQHAPCWVAYVTDRASAKVAAKKSRTGTAFKRPSQFFTEGVVADASKLIGVEPAEHADYSDKVPDGLDAADKVPATITALKARSFPAIIERGHMAPNNTMKCWGSATRGEEAQTESFSLANVVAQTSGHNAPTWSELEAQCLAWANELGSVCVVAGPIYHDAAHRKHIQDRKNGEESDIPFAEALFCIVIGKRNGHVTAIGFIMPDVTARYSYRDKAVPIHDIEQATGINFMPKLGDTNPLEQAVDTAWLNN
jgi:DNA/RNA endonuclease G (NUC1)